VPGTDFALKDRMPGIGRPFQRSCQLFVAALACFGALFTTGCDACNAGDALCEGNVLHWCNVNDDSAFAGNDWVDYHCPVTCHAAGGTAQCVESSGPIPECAGDPNGKTCYGNNVSDCWDGYLLQGQSCDSATCVASACGPICAAGAADPRCAQSDSFCDGDDAWIECYCGYVSNRIPCDPGLSCQVAHGAVLCLSPTPDPRCDPTQAGSSFCDGTVITICWYGYLTNSSDCALGSPPSVCVPVTTPESGVECDSAH